MIGSGCLNLRKLNDGLGEPPLRLQNRDDDGRDADEHDDALQKVVDDRGHVTTKNNVYAGHDGHADDAPLVGHAERHREQTRQAIVDRCGVGDEEHEDDGSRGNAQALALVAFAEELGHRRGLESLRDLTCARTENPPGKQAADHGVANTRPGRGHAVLPTKLASVADEDDGAEVGGAVGEGRKPRTDVTTTENEAVDIA